MSLNNKCKQLSANKKTSISNNLNKLSHDSWINILERIKYKGILNTSPLKLNFYDKTNNIYNSK